MGFLHSPTQQIASPMHPSSSVMSPTCLETLSPEACEAVQGGAISIPVLSLKTLLPRFGSNGPAPAPSSDPGSSSITNIGSIGTSLVSVGAIYL